MNPAKKLWCRTFPAHADKEANPLYPVPILWDARELEIIFRKAGELDEQ